jgi:uncharacterized protein (DUF1800 family)
MKTLKKILLWLMLPCVLLACSDGADKTQSQQAQGNQAFDVGMTLASTTLSDQNASFFAAARFLEQATFGYTLNDVKRVQALGFAGWIDEQYALPATKIDMSPVCCYNVNLPFNTTIGRYPANSVMDAMVSAPDQLRLRTTWSVQMYVPIDWGKVQSPGQVAYFNYLQDNALGKYSDFIRSLTRNTSMAFYLDLWKNKKPGACSTCDLNENYPRELMQLFTLGTVLLNPDGTVKLGSNQRPIDTYTQADVSDMTRALTGWDFDGSKKENDPSANAIGYEKPMQAPWPDNHDSGEKTLLGSKISAGGTPQQDLDAVVKILMAHPNTAPFVSYRMIQNLVTSDPSPTYVSRVAAVFNSTGGDMKQVVKAILLDPEARAGDVHNGAQNLTGKVREPMLFVTQVWRALGCRKVPVAPWDSDVTQRVLNNQAPFSNESVFGFYEPNYAPIGKTRPAPESKLDNSQMLGQEMGLLSSYAWQPERIKLLTDAGCAVQPLIDAYKTPDQFLAMVNQLFFKQAMPVVVMNGGTRLTEALKTRTSNDTDRTLLLISILLGTPSFGVMK